MKKVTLSLATLIILSSATIVGADFKSNGEVETFGKHDVHKFAGKHDVHRDNNNSYLLAGKHDVHRSNSLNQTNKEMV
ncbi:hypothetical protein ABC345_20830 [Shouchella sp. 1P09AA]|uniref:hypothetical protein n=1 Tax=unclassified Shouchella TaxID=2893065 RepID=UPI0039A1EC49